MHCKGEYITYKILEVEPAAYNTGGTEQFIKNNIQYIDKDTFCVDFLCCGNVCNEKSFENFKGNFNQADALNIDYGLLKPIKIIIRLFKYLKQNHYDIVHIHNGFILYHAACALAAKLSGVPHIVCHLHGTDLIQDHNKIKCFIKKLRKKFDLFILRHTATDFYTCSKGAAKLSFGDKFIHKYPVQFFPNAIESKKFLYNQSVREQLRQQYHLTNKFVIGTVGRLSKEKNQTFLIDIFNKIYQKHPDSVLMFVGEGTFKPQLDNKIHELNLEKNVIFTGSVNNVNEYLQAFDVFVLPSLTEAYPIVMVEAQAAGLPTIVSDVITKETAITDLVTYINLNNSAQIWADSILKYRSYERKIPDFPEEYNLSANLHRLESVYLNLLSQ